MKTYLSIRLSEKLKKFVADQAEIEGRSSSNLACFIINEEMKKRKNKPAKKQKKPSV